MAISDINSTLANGAYGHVTMYSGIAIQEIAGREGSDNAGSSTAEITWRVSGSADPTVCRTALLASAVTVNTYDGLAIESLSRERVTDTTWDFTASYSQRQPESGSYTVTIDTTGGSIIQTYSYAQTSFVATGATATDYKNAIDVQDGTPQGVQRVIPAMSIQVRAKIASAYVSSPMAYAKICSDLTGTTNNAAAFGGIYAAGELLFVGATGEVIGEEPTLTFNFLASKNVTGLTIGTITGIAKGGHDYLWFAFFGAKDAVTNVKTTAPRAAYVDQVYGPADHTLMKIGVA